MVNIQNKVYKDTPHKYGKNNQKEFIVVHQTGNTDEGANAETHHKLQKNNPRKASWHISVDDTEAIQSFDYDFQLWHAGDGRGHGNLNGIAVELCINSDGDYKKTIENGADVVKQLMKKFDIPIYRVKQHHNFSGKNCPAQIRGNYKGIDWNDFLDLVKEKPLRNKDTSQKPKAQDTNSIVDFLNANNQDSSYPARAKLAKQYGIEGYRGTAKQNLALLGKIRGKVKPTPKPKAPTKKYTKGLDETSIVDFLNKNGEDSSYDARRELAKQEGIKGYRGTAKQNTDLLDILKKK